MAATWAGLEAGARFAAAFGGTNLADRFRSAGDEVRAAVERHLWSADANRFVRSLKPLPGGGWEQDATIDAALCGLWYFGLFAPDDPRIVSTMEAIHERLWVKSDVGGVARYEGDYYNRVSNDVARVPGNPWIICTLWLAQWQIATARSAADLEPALELLRWAEAAGLPSGVLPEQVNPYTREPLSVSPLTWSHAALVQTIGEYLEKRRALQATTAL